MVSGRWGRHAPCVGGGMARAKRDWEPHRRRIVRSARAVFRQQRKSPRTIKCYLGWIRRFLWFHEDRDPRELGEEELTTWLNHLVLERNVSASTQKQALCALKALYGQVYQEEFPWLADLIEPKRPKVLPSFLTWGELEAVCAQLHGVILLIFYVLFGSGLRLSECLSLRIKDVDLNHGLLFVRAGKGHKDRTVMLAKPAVELMSQQLSRVYQLHQSDLKDGGGHVALPYALARKYPNASREWRYQWVFPATRKYRCRRTGEVRRHHLHPTTVQRRLKAAVRATGITKKCTAHTLRHSFALHLLDIEPDMRKLQGLMGHKDIRTTMIYAQLRRDLRGGIPSPADRLGGGGAWQDAEWGEGELGGDGLGDDGLGANGLGGGAGTGAGGVGVDALGDGAGAGDEGDALGDDGLEGDDDDLES